LRLARAQEPIRDLNSKRKSMLFSQDRDYYDHIFNDPDLVDLKITSVCGDKNSIVDGWFMRLVTSLHHKYDVDLTMVHYLITIKPPDILCYDYITIDNSTKLFSDDSCPVAVDLTVLDFLSPGIVQKGDRSWFVMSQYDDVDNFYTTKACKLYSEVLNKINLMVKSYEEGFRQEFTYAIRLPYVSRVTTVVLNSLLTLLQPGALNIYPSNNPHEEFFLLFVRITPCYLHHKDEDKYNFSAYLTRVFNRFKVAVHRRDWFFLNDNVNFKLPPNPNTMHMEKIKFDFRNSFNSLDYLSMPVRILFEKKRLKSTYQEKAKKVKKREELMVSYMKSCMDDAALFG